jgi:hypothetical protein
MAKRKKSINFPSSAGKFDIAFRALMIHLGLADPSSGSTSISWTRLGISGAQYNALLAILGNAITANTWLFVRPLQENKATRNATLRGQEKALIKAALLIIRPLRTTLKAANKLTPGFLTAGDAQSFFIPEPNPHTNSVATFRITAPVPLLTMHSVKHLEHFIDARDAATPESNAMPEGVMFVWLKRYIGIAAPTDESQFTHLMFSGKFRNISTFLATHAKQDVWYTAAFICITGELGQFSPFLHSNVAQTA